ncbi:MAG: tetratricopeptide repeat protein [Fibromonadaceae bacterium]|jgi:putative thioredoxin|nr:tetratricopeptide repeat protein [Fibromonadaceae bacterium]
MSIIQTNIETFEQVAINGSDEKAIAVAFEVSPALEKLSNELNFTIAKLDPEDPNNQQLVGLLRISAISDIRIFKNKQMAGGADGSLPESELKKQLSPFFLSEEDSLIINAEDAINLGQASAAVKILQKLFEKNPGNKKVCYLLAKAKTMSGKSAEAKSILQSIKETDDFYNESKSLLELMEFYEEALPPYDKAYKLASQNKYREALDCFLELIANKQDSEGKAKKAMVTLFSVLGPKHELTWEYRAKLNRLIYI